MQDQETMTIECGGTIPTVQYGNRTIKITRTVIPQPGETLQQASVRAFEELFNAYNAEEVEIKAHYGR